MEAANKNKSISNYQKINNLLTDPWKLKRKTLGKEKEAKYLISLPERGVPK